MPIRPFRSASLSPQGQVTEKLSAVDLLFFIKDLFTHNYFSSDLPYVKKKLGKTKVQWWWTTNQVQGTLKYKNQIIKLEW